MSEMTNETAQAATQPEQTVATGSSASSPISPREKHTARLMELNKDDVETLGDVTKPTENKPTRNDVVKTDLKPKKDERPRIDSNDRRIAQLDAQKKAMQAKHDLEMQDLKREFAELKAAMNPKKVEPVKTEKDFANKAEFDRYQMEQIANKANDERFIAFKKEQEQKLAQEQEVQKFRQDFSQRIHDNFDSQDEISEFNEMLKVPDSLSKDIHEYIQNSEIGPRMLKFFFLRPDLAQGLERMPVNMRTARLSQLETSLWNERQQERVNARSTQANAGQPARKVTAAPAPIGSLSTGGQSDGEVDGAAAVAAYKKRRTGR